MVAGHLRHPQLAEEDPSAAAAMLAFSYATRRSMARRAAEASRFIAAHA